MWHWIQNALSKKRQQFFFDILIFVTSIHVCILLSAIFYNGRRAIEQISLVAPDIRGSTLVFVPLCKKIEQPQVKKSGTSLQKPHHMMNYDEFLERQKKAELAQKKSSNKTGLAKTASGKKTVQKKPLPDKTDVKKTAVLPSKKVEVKKEVAANVSAVKPVEKKAAAVKNLPAQKAQSEKKIPSTSIKHEGAQPKKVEVKKTAEKKVEKKVEVSPENVEVVVENIQAPIEKQIEKPIEKTLPKEQKAVAQQIVLPQKVEELVSQEIVNQESEPEVIQENNSKIVDQQKDVLPLLDMNDVTFVGVQDLEHLQVQQLVAGQLAKHWKRPVGMTNKICVIRIELHASGKIVEATVEKSSGVPMYDMAAKAAALKTAYPQEIWNKKLVIQF